MTIIHAQEVKQVNLCQCFLNILMSRGGDLFVVTLALLDYSSVAQTLGYSATVLTHPYGVTVLHILTALVNTPTLR